MPPHAQGTPQEKSHGPMPAHPRDTLQQRPQNTNPHPQTQPSQETPQQRLSNNRREREAQGSKPMSDINVQEARPAMPGADAGLHPARTQPLSNESLESKGKTDGEEPRASILQERKRRAAESQRPLRERQGQQNRNDCRHEDHDAESCPRQTESGSKREQAEESQIISGPQSMLNMFKARADAAIEASGDCPSFTDRKSHPILIVCHSVS